MPAIPPLLPSTLLERRPDIAAQERQVAAANARIGVAQAAFYPSFNLSGTLGWRASSFADLPCKVADSMALQRARDAVLARFAGQPLIASGLGLQTSMRNQLPCEVQDVEVLAPADLTVRVRLCTPGRAILVASVTRESADLLALGPGLRVLVLCKATAVKVQAVDEGQTEPIQTAAENELPGEVERVSAGAGQDEVVLALHGGGHWVGFATHPFRATPGHPATARMAHSALVLALPR